MQEIEKNEPRLGDEIPESILKQAEDEIKKKYKSITLPAFKGKTDCVVHIYHPNPGEASIASDAYSEAFSKFISNSNLLTKDQLLEKIKEKGIWGDKDEALIESLRDDLHDIELNVAQMRKRGRYTKQQMDVWRSKWYAVKNQLHDVLRKQTELLSNSIEGRASEQEIKVKMSLCVKYPDGKRVWNSVEELNNEEEFNVVIFLVKECMMFWSGLTQEIIDVLPAELIFGGEEKESVN